MSTEAPPPLSPAPRRSLLWLWLTLGAVALVLLVCGTAGVLFVLDRVRGGASTGDVLITVQVRDPADAPLPAADLAHTRQVLQSRLAAAGLTRPTVTVTGTDTLRITVGPTDGERAKSLLVPGKLAFRKVLQTSQGNPGTASCAPGSGHPTRAQALASAKAKLGAEFDLAGQIRDPSQADPSKFPAFATLTCAELAAIPAQMQFFVPTVSCAMLNGRDPDALDDTSDATVACDQQGTTRYALDVAKVTGTDVADARAGTEQGMSTVTVHFTSNGQVKWTALTREATQSASDSSGTPAQVAITLDQLVLSAPQIQSVITGDALIAGGGIDEAHAKNLGAVIRYGPLPVRFSVLAISVVR